ncbi:CinA family protein [Filimonas effusa]|nr:CinA family protein [Filimonas effusa]
MKNEYDLASIERIKTVLIKNRMSLSVAESVTSGHLQAALSLAQEASRFFQGGITVYNSGQKTRHLKVEPISALECNCVGQLVSNQMAVECNAHFLSEYAIGITGYATPVPEMGITALFAYLSVAQGDTVVLEEKIPVDRSQPGSPPENDSYAIQVYYANRALRHLASLL